MVNAADCATSGWVQNAGTGIQATTMTTLYRESYSQTHIRSQPLKKQHPTEVCSPQLALLMAGSPSHGDNAQRANVQLSHICEIELNASPQCYVWKTIIKGCCVLDCDTPNNFTLLLTYHLFFEDVEKHETARVMAIVLTTSRLRMRMTCY